MSEKRRRIKAASWRNADTGEAFQTLEVKEGEVRIPSSDDDEEASVELIIVNHQESKPIQEVWAREGGDIELRMQLENTEQEHTLTGQPQFRLISSTTTRLGMDLDTEELPIFRQ